jgi:hypothetical protein
MGQLDTQTISWFIGNSAVDNLRWVMQRLPFRVAPRWGVEPPAGGHHGGPAGGLTDGGNSRLAGTLSESWFGYAAIAIGNLVNRGDIERRSASFLFVSLPMISSATSRAFVCFVDEPAPSERREAVSRSA